MQISFERRAHAVFIELQGELDHHSASYAREQIDPYLTTNPGQRYIFDLTGLRFMDSSGIGVILGRFQTIRALSGQLQIVCQKPQIQKILEMAGIPKLIPVFSTIEEALAAGEGDTHAHE